MNKRMNILMNDQGNERRHEGNERELNKSSHNENKKIF